MKRWVGCLLVLGTMNCWAQTGNINGKIAALDSITPVGNVSVYLQGTKYGAATNGNGFFEINGVKSGAYDLVVKNVGYATETRKVNVVKDKTTTVDFFMIEMVTDLPAVVIESVSLTGGMQGVKEIPGSAHYISPKQIEKFSYTDINRTLRAVPGLNLQEEDGFGLRPNIGLRGTGSERSSKITVMEDGVLMAPAPYAAPAAYYFPTIGRMQAVEVLKGSSQIKYGPYTTGGAINLISTQIPEGFSGKINLLGGSFNSFNLHAHIGMAHKNVAYMVETFQYTSGGFKQLDGGGDTGFDKKDFLAKVRVNTNPTAKVYQSATFKIGYVSELSNETYLGLTDPDFVANPYRRYAASQKDQMNTEQLQYSLRHIIQPAKFMNITTTAYRSDFKRNWYKLDKVIDSSGTNIKIADLLETSTIFGDAYSILTGTSSQNDDALQVKANNRKYYAHGIQTVIGFNFKTGKIKHDLHVGIRYHEDQIDRFQWVDGYNMDNGVMELTASGIPGTESNRIESAKALAAYIQYRFMFNDLTITPGIRYENIAMLRSDYGKNDPERTGHDLSTRSNYVDVYIPGIGVDYKFTEQLSAFAGVHKGFSPPGSRSETSPEESVNYEAGVRYGKQTISIQAVGFFNDYTNLLGTDLAAAGGGGTTDQFNGGDVHSYGLEFQASYDILSMFKTKLSAPLSIVYTYTDAVFQNDFDSDLGAWGTVDKGDHLPYLANHQLTFLFGVDHQKFSINISGKYLSEMRTVAGQGNIQDNERTDAQFIIDLSASYHMMRNISIFANLTNIADEVYVVARRPAGLRPGMPRAFMVGLKATF